MQKFIAIVIILMTTVIGLVKCGQKRMRCRIGNLIPYIVPDEAKIPATGGCSRHSVVNPTEHRYAYNLIASNSVKCSVEKSFGFLEPIDSMEYHIDRFPGTPKSAQIKFVFKEAAVNEEDAEAAFRKSVCKAYEGLIHIRSQ